MLLFSELNMSKSTKRKLSLTPELRKGVFMQATDVQNPNFQQATNTPLPVSPTIEGSSAWGVSAENSLQTVNTRKWTEQEKTVIDEHILYHKKIQLELENMKKQGCKGKLPKMPSKPSDKLVDLFSSSKKARKQSPEDLHNFLKSQIIDTNITISREAFNFRTPQNEHEIIEQLNRGVRNMKRQDAQTIMFSVQFGQYLQQCKDWLEKERSEGRINITWSKWLEQKADYSDAHARKLRILSSILIDYPQFYKLGLSFGFVYSKKDQIKNMLKIPEYQEFWKKDLVLPHTSELQSSQE